MVDTDETLQTTYNRRRMMPGVWHKLPTGELKKEKERKSWWKEDGRLSSSSTGKLKTFHLAV